MTTLVPLLLGCSAFALGLPGSLGVVGLIALGDVRVRWDGLPLIVGFVCCWSATEDCSWPVDLAPLLLSVCAASAYLCPMRALVCCGGMHWWMWGCLFFVCSSFWCMLSVLVGGGVCWWGLVSVDADVFRCGWCDRSWVVLGAAV